MGERIQQGVRPSHGSRLPGIEGLRAVAALSVLALHVWMYSSPSGSVVSPGLLGRVVPDLGFGVILFFTLSGFLLYRPFAAAIVRGAKLPSCRSYLRNRALRILPAYWVILALTAIIFQSVLIRHGARFVVGSGLNAGFLARTGLLTQDYQPQTLDNGIGPAWSLAVEALFYLLLPLLAIATAAMSSRLDTRARRRLAAVAPAVLLLVVGLSGKAVAGFVVKPAYPYAGFNNDWHSVIERSFWAQADLFAFGMALAVIRADWEDGLVRLPRHWRGLAWVGVVGAYLLTTLTHRNEQLSYSPYNTLIALAFALVLALVVLWDPLERRPPTAVRLLESRALVAIGVVSYSLFLWHEPLVRFMRAHGLTFGGPVGLVGNLVEVGILAGVLSVITYRFVEAPALRRGKRTTLPAPGVAHPAGPVAEEREVATAGAGAPTSSVALGVGAPTPVKPKPS